MVSFRFAATQLADGAERVELFEDVAGGLFRRANSRIVPAGDWPKHAPKAGLAALAAARAAAGSFTLDQDEQGVTLPPEVAARLDEADAHALGLPPATPLTLQLRSTGSLAEGTIQVARKWIRRGGVPARGTRTGARVAEGGATGRLAEPLFSAAVAAEKVNESKDEDGRRAAFAQLRETLGEEIGAGIEADGFIQRIRIAYATNFSLDMKTSAGRFDFDPVLFGRQVQEAEDGDLVDESQSSLLTPGESLVFQARFRSNDTARRSYLMPDGTLLFLDPLLGRALDVVRQKQTAPAGERRDFLRAPQRQLREALALDEGGDDEAADRLFIETRQFSDRVSGIEVWHKPVLPWIKPKPNSWLPEAFGLRVGDPPEERYLPLEAGDAAQIERAVEAAIRVREETVPWKGELLPATAGTLKAAQGIAELEREVAAAAEGTADAVAPPEPLQTFFLQVGQNFETLDYARLPRRGAGGPPFAPPPVPDKVVSVPKPHQLQAFAWLTEAWTRKVPGLLLADDMGLGKTFQALMFLQYLRDQGAPNRPILIVAPTGLLRNWQAEMRQHLAPGALGPLVEAFGTGLAQFRTGAGNDIHGGTTRLDVERWDEAGIVLTTYETMRDYHMSFARIRFAAVVLDEVQKLKNPASQMTRAAKALNADIQIAMTGTPVENRLQDLWSIADTVFPGFLGTSREFEASYPATDREALAALQSLLIHRDDTLPPFMLRRMKDEILTGLPPKTSQKYHVDMPQPQAAAYDRVLARARALRQSGEKGAMLKVLHMLRGTSLHPEPPRGVKDIGAYIGRSARLRKTFEILEQVRQNGEKALIFCEDLEMQAFLAMALQDRFGLQRLPSCISGEIAGPKRQDLVNEFQARGPGFDVMILSPKAGGVGLTITAANHVIHLSRWWNPAVEDQATDRVYRIGQERPVTVHIPLATHPDAAIGPSSFDRRLDDLMERKRALSRGLLVPPESESDVEDLLADVLDGGRQSASAPEAEPTIQAHAESSGVVPLARAALRELTGEAAKSPPPEPASSATPRPVLSLRETPVEAGERRATTVRRVEFAQGGTRDWTIFDQYLDGAVIVRLEVQDPYCCAGDDARGRLVGFLKRFAEKAARLDRVEILTFDAESVATRQVETTRAQREELERRWKARLGNIDLRLTQRSKRAGGDLHDRFVRAHLAGGESVVWDIGRGIDGIMSARWSCVVNAFHENSPA
ncbi:MAG TPA: DEAD/DEAH box helicase [Allosphingosinicella sp.]|jgi:hypothetical protein